MTAKYRWFALTYLVFAFFLVPLVFMGLSLWGTAPVVIATVLAVGTGLFVTVVNVMQARYPARLPATLRTWDFLPAYLRSLEPLDRLVCVPLGAALGKACCSCKKAPQRTAESTTTITKVASKVTTASSDAGSDKTGNSVSTTASEIEIAAQRISN